MNRMMTDAHETIARDVAAAWLPHADEGVSIVGPVLLELDASREVEHVLILALERVLADFNEGGMAECYCRFEPPSSEPCAVCVARDALRMAETREGYAAWKERQIQQMGTMLFVDSFEHYPAKEGAAKWPSPELESAHAREQEDVCDTCGARTFSGICSAKCGG